MSAAELPKQRHEDDHFHVPYDGRLRVRYHQSTVRALDQQKVAKNLLASGFREPDRPKDFAGAPAGGDREAMRGVPIIANGVGGTSGLTEPLSALIAKENSRARQHLNQAAEHLNGRWHETPQQAALRDLGYTVARELGLLRLIRRLGMQPKPWLQKRDDAYRDSRPRLDG